MTQIVYRANLSANSFPFLSESFGNSIVVKQYDQNYNRTVTSKEDADKDVGIPQIYYCHNVMPTPSGFQSVGYKTRTPAISPSETGFTQQNSIRDAAENQAYFSVTSDGRCFVGLAPTYAWSSVTPPPGITAAAVTIAHVSGTSYIYFAKIGCYKYDWATNTLIAVTLTGLDATTILGITSAAGYLVVWSAGAIAWSSTIDPTDFTPSLVTGAGGGAVQGAKGAITVVMPHILGFIVYTTNNAVAGLYSGNTRYPFNFREIVSSGGCSSLELIDWDATTGNHWVYTSAGLQLVSTQQSNTSYTDITDFVSGKRFEDFDEVTSTFTTTDLTSQMQKKLTVIASRYLVISYGINELTHAIVLDLIMKRFGKIKVTHVDCFDWTTLSTASPNVEAPRESFGFLQKNGTVLTVDFTRSAANGDGVMLLGKYQMVRSRLLQLDSIELDNVQVAANFTLTVLSAPEGKNNTLRTTPTLAESTQLYRKYMTRVSALNHSLLFVGAFDVNSLVLAFNIHGRR